MRTTALRLAAIPLTTTLLALAQPAAAQVASPFAGEPHLDPRMRLLTPAAIDGEQIEPTPVIVDDEFVVRFTPEAALLVRSMGAFDLGLTGLTPLDDAAERAGVIGYRQLFVGSDPVKDLMLGGEDLSGWFVLRIDPQANSVREAMRRMAESPFVAHAEEIGIHAIDQTPNDPSFPGQWSLRQTSDRDIDATEGWDINTGSPSVIVAVLDTGVRYFHKDLGGTGGSWSNPGGANGNIWINLAEKNGAAGVDDDANGYVDDWVGYDFVTAPAAACWSGEDCTGADNDPRDFNGHGTHCAGIVGAMSNNGFGVASPAGGWGTGTNGTTGNGAKVMCLRIGHSASIGGGQVGVVRMDSAASALYYAANKGARIASCSWGSSDTGGLGAATTFFINAGGLVFKAAGNSNNQNADYLCSRSDVYSVAATGQTDAKASFSSYGTWVDISAPGVSINSTYHKATNPGSDQFAALSGTSMATPLVASVAATVWSKHPTWTRAQVWDAVRLNTDNIDAQNPSFLGKLGSGRLNMQKALTP
jgi:subtilisin family serine protease